VTDGIFDDYLEAKYASGGPDGSRFEALDDEFHTSKIGQCQRRLWYERRNPQPDEASPYFELGRVFELIYGAALAWRHGDLDEADLSANRPWDLPPMVDAVEQDVNIEIEIDDGVSITGEADWVVYEDAALPAVRAHGGVDGMALDAETGDRAIRWADGEAERLSGGAPGSSPVAKVVETKTIKELSILGGSPKASHLHQLWGYMWGMGAPGEWAYMVRDDLTTEHHPEPYDEDLFVDVEIRARQHARNLAGGAEEPSEVPANPANRWSCYYCPHKYDCDDSKA